MRHDSFIEAFDKWHKREFWAHVQTETTHSFAASARLSKFTYCRCVKGCISLYIYTGIMHICVCMHVCMSACEYVYSVSMRVYMYIQCHLCISGTRRRKMYNSSLLNVWLLVAECMTPRCWGKGKKVYLLEACYSCLNDMQVIVASTIFDLPQ